MSTLSAHTQILGSSSQGGNNQVISRRQLDLYRQVELKRQMHLNMLELLQRHLDPMVAAQVYNARKGALSNFPDEILLLIFGNFANEEGVATLYCLRRVSATFRRLVYDSVLWEDMPQFRPTISSWSSEPRWPATPEHREQLRQLCRFIQRDGLCIGCKKVHMGPREEYPRFLRQRYSFQPRASGSRHICMFDAQMYYKPHCDGCDTQHDTQSFSIHDRDSERGRSCLGRQGGVQLCEHVHVYWSDIEDHIASWRKRKPEPLWDACLDDFVIECRDSSHDTRCTVDRTPTWPRARLQTDDECGELVVFTLEWEPHSGVETFTLTPGGKMPAPDLRWMFRRHRKGAAGILLPPRPSTRYEPEMTCFGSDQCRCVHYEDSNTPDEAGPSKVSCLPSDDNSSTNCFDHRHKRLFRGRGKGTTVEISKHGRAGNSMCLVTAYRCEVTAFRKTDGKINPSHGWFHAMDPDTYCHPYHIFRCKDSGCMNYYRRQGSYRCRAG